jgi:hypothetical protein
MSASFASTLRTRPAEIQLAVPGPATIRMRVEMPEVWDVVRFCAAPDERVLTVKVKALDALFPAAEHHEDFVLKYSGWEILDEGMTLAEAGVVDGSIMLLTHRRRRPVR